MLRNHSVHLLFSRLFSIRHNFLLVHALFSHFFFSLSLLICGTPFRPSHSVPCTSSELSLWGHPPSRRAIRSEAQVQGYQRGAGPCSQRHDLSLRGSRVLSSVLAKLKSAFSLWYLCSHFLPPGLILQATVCCDCDCDCVTEIKTGSPHLHALLFSFFPLAALEP